MSKKLNKITIICALTFFLCQTACTPSYYKLVKSDVPPADGRGNITGTVISEDDGQPLENVEILLCRDVAMISGCSRQIGQTETDRNGVYWFRNLPPGDYVPAIRQSETTMYILQEKQKAGAFPKAVLFKLEAGQTIQIEPQRVSVETRSNPTVKLIFPTTFETIQDRRPKLSWEAYPDADNYTPYLVKIDSSSGNSTDVKLESGTLASIKTTSVLPVNELEDGIYLWGVYVSGKTHTDTFAAIAKATDYFVVIGAEQTEK